MSSSPQARQEAVSGAMVVFGASGDLARRKLFPALYALEKQECFARDFEVIGFGRTPITDEEFRGRAEEALRQHAGLSPDEDAWNRFARRLLYQQGSYDDLDSLRALKDRVKKVGNQGDCGCLLYYLAVPPQVSENLLDQMRSLDMGSGFPAEGSPRLLFEKPFGLGLDDARRLNELLGQLFIESEVYRIDHYLAKDTVQNLLVLRFGNLFLEPLWNRHYIDNVQITAAEDIGLEGRGGYYDSAGVVRDMLQNHVLQVLALVAMEPPVPGRAESVRDRKVDVFRSLCSLSDEDFVLGQYEGYLEEPDVAEDSRIPTFAAVRLNLDNWRWQGVPFFVRAGKRLAAKVTEVVVCFKEVPACVLGGPEPCAVPPNALIIRIQPDEGVQLRFATKVPGYEDRITPTYLDFRYASLGKELPEAYERVLLECLRGDPALFWRSDGIEEAWKAVTPLLESSGEGGEERLLTYAPGSWGPSKAAGLLGRSGRTWLTNGGASADAGR